jgi:ankyrin repeat protein
MSERGDELEILAWAESHIQRHMTSFADNVVNQVDHVGGTPLLYASFRGKSSLVSNLLRRGADPTTTNDAGFNCLHVSAMSGDVETARLLLDAGTDVHALESLSGTSPLHIAAQLGNTEFMLLLLDAGADADFRSTSGETPLFLASTRGEVGAVRLLLEKNASPTQKCLEHTPLEIAAKRGHVEVVREFMSRVGFEACGGEESMIALTYAAVCPNIPNTLVMEVLIDGGVWDHGGRTLCTAVSFGKEDSVKFLIQKAKEEFIEEHLIGAYIVTAADDGFRAMDCCFRPSAVKMFSCRIVRMLMEFRLDERDLFHGHGITFLERLISRRQNDLGKNNAKVIGLKEVRRLLMQAPAVWAKSWVWSREESGEVRVRRTQTKINVYRAPGNVLIRALSRK